jgi:hypothetical protein
MYKSVILTIPHSQCLEYKYHTCDIAAQKFAIILKLKLDKIIDTHIIKSNQNRIILDDNRYFNSTLNIKKDSKLWDNLRKLVISHKNIIIFDIHSFPENTKNFNDNDIVILDINPYQLVSRELKKYMQTNSVKIDILTAKIGSNSILDIMTLNPHYIPTILLEINEKYVNDENKLELFASLISDFIIQKMIVQKGGYEYLETKFHYLRLKNVFPIIYPQKEKVLNLH